MWRAGAFTLVVSPQILQEYVAKFIDKGIDEDLILKFVETIGRIALNIPGAYETAALDKIDEKDNKFLAACLESGADFLVSGDKKHLLPLKHFHGTQIRSAELFIKAMVGLPDEEAEREQLDADLDQELQTLKEETFARRQKVSPPPSDI